MTHNRMKSILLLMMLLALLAACSGGNETTEGETADEAASNDSPAAVEANENAGEKSGGETAATTADTASEPRPAPIIDPDSPIFATAAYSLAELIPASFSLETLPIPENGEFPNHSLEAYYVTETALADVLDFYKETLVDLGWTFENEFDQRLEFSAGVDGVRVYVQDDPVDPATIVFVSVYAQSPEIAFSSVPVMDDAQLGRLVWGRSAVYLENPLTTAEILQFYRDTMPAGGWTLRNEAAEVNNESWLDFVRNSDSGEDVATVRVEAGDGAGTPAQVHVSVSYAAPRQIALADFGYFYEEGISSTILAAAQDPLIPTAEAGFAFPADTTLPPFNSAAFSGDIAASGSSAIFPLAEAVAERFQDDGFGGNITIDNIGSTLNPLCSGEADIANYVAQIIGRSDLDECAPEGAEGIDFVVGRDVLVMAVNPANDFATEMTQAELALALTTAETWADVNPDWPDLPIQRFYPAISYGMLAGFLGADPESIENAGNLTRSENDLALVDGVAQNEGAIGFFAYGVYEENQESVTAVRLDGNAPQDNDYLFSLPLHMVTFDTILQEKPQVAAYLGYVLVYGPELALDVGFAPPDVETRQENEALWLEIMGK